VRNGIVFLIREIICDNNFNRMLRVEWRIKIEIPEYLIASTQSGESFF